MAIPFCSLVTPPSPSNLPVCRSLYLPRSALLQCLPFFFRQLTRYRLALRSPRRPRSSPAQPTRPPVGSFSCSLRLQIGCGQVRFGLTLGREWKGDKAEGQAAGRTTDGKKGRKKRRKEGG